jgi:type IV secretory pathway ATPase VirB11/archaellum biosynthesis ATPase
MISSRTLTPIHPVFPVLGMCGERQRLRDAFEKRESLLIAGPAGAGKTALIHAAIGDLPDRRGFDLIPWIRPK